MISPLSRYRSVAARQLALASCYALLAEFVLAIFPAGNSITVVWLPGGLALSALLLGGNKYILGVFIGAFAAGVWVGHSFGVSVSIALGNTLESWLIAWLLWRNRHFHNLLIRPCDYLWLLSMTGIGACVSALIGPGTFLLAGFLSPAVFLPNLLHWWMGDVLGIVLVAPLLLVWQRPPQNDFDPKHAWETLACFGLALLAGQIVFLGWFHEFFAPFANGFLMIVFVAWSALRLGRHGVLVVIGITAAQALLGAVWETGYFAHDLTDTGLLNFWLYIMVLTLVGTILASTIEQRQYLMDALQDRESMYRSILDATPDAMIISDAQGIIVLANQLANTMLGYQNGELIGQSIENLVPERFRERHKKLRLGYTAKPVFRPMNSGADVVALRHDGSEFDVEISLSPIETKQGLLVASAFRDVTRKKQAVDALRASEDRFRRLANSSSIMIWITDAKGEPVFVNQSWFDFTGIDSIQTLTHKDWIHTVHPDDRETAFATYYQDTAAHKAITTEYRLRNAAGDWCWILDKGMPLYDENGAFTGYIGSAIDISERKQIQQALQDKEQMLSESQRIAHVGSWSVELTTDCVNWSDETYHIYGVRPETFKPSVKTFLDLIHPDDRVAMKRWVSDCRTGKAPPELDFRVMLPDGAVRYIRGSGGLQYDEMGRPLRMVGCVQDITERKYAEDVLQNSEAKFHALYDSTCDAVMLLGEEKFFDCNTAALKLFGCATLDAFCTKTPADLSPPRQPCGTSSMELANQRIAVAKDKGSLRFEWMHKRCDSDEIFPAEVQLNVIELDRKQVIQASVRDISERRQAENNLRVAAVAFESQESMMITDANSVILRVNKAFTETTGYEADELIGQTPSLLKSGRHNADFYAEMWETLLRTGTWQGEIFDKRKNGKIYPKYLTISAVKGSDGATSHYVGTHLDITVSKAAAAEIERLAFYDPLTRLPNRRLLLDRLKPALASSHRSGRKGALLFIDMDNFKTLNDTLGHDMGDLLLQQVAQRLESCVREGDTVARLGGDEFVVMLEDLSEQAGEAAVQTEIIGEKILAILNRTYQLASHSYRSTPSIGAILFNDHQQTIEELMKQADIAMYQAKSSGRNALRFFDPQMQISIAARVALEGDLRLALAENQFILYYQPQVCHNYRIIGAEVLIRWQHPTRGLVPPVDFIPLAEETGLILLIGQWVLETACAQIKTWEGSEHTRHLLLAVNVSAKQFHQADFVEQVSHALHHSGINPDKLKLELTESLVLDNIEDTIFKMNALREIGVRFSMDDFGTGYSSLSSLKKLPLSQLKIDQSFVRDLTINPDDAVIVQTIIAMANNLGIGVIAEGVETEAQRIFLELHNCPLFQGYLFSKPVPIEQFEQLLKCN